MPNHRCAWWSLALCAAACSIAASAAHADDLSYFDRQIEPYTKKPEFVAAGPAFDAQACMKGKTILSIPVSSANPFTANIEKAMAAAAKKVGFKFITWRIRAKARSGCKGWTQP
jgi:ribose transport system substrate-binding protein